MRWLRRRRHGEPATETPVVEVSDDPDDTLDDPIAESRRLNLLRASAARDLRVIAERLREDRAHHA